MRRSALLLMAAGFVLAAATAVGAAQAAPDATIPAAASERIVGDLAHADLNAFAVDAAKYMAPHASDRLKNNFASIKDLGQSQYSELVYSRDYGQMEKDIIYKIDFDKAFAFVRFLWHVDNGTWCTSRTRRRVACPSPAAGSTSTRNDGRRRTAYAAEHASVVGRVERSATRRLGQGCTAGFAALHPPYNH